MWLPGPNPFDAIVTAGTLLRSGLVRVYRPDHLVRLGLGVSRYQMTPAAGPMVGAIVFPDALAVVDDSGSTTMRQLDSRCSAVAGGLAAAGLAPGDTIGVLARNSVAFYEAVVGASRLGLDIVYLNTGFAARQVAAITADRRLRALLYDPEFADRVPSSVLGIATGDGTDATVPVLDALAASADDTPPRTDRPSRHVILTSGTTGQPKDAARTGGGLESVVGLLSGLPLRARETHLIAAPMFHAWGWLNMLLTMVLSSTVVLSRRFDPRATLAMIERERCHVLVAVPTMLRRILDLPVTVRRRYDTSSLRVVAVSGSAMPYGLARTFMEEYGEILYSLYGSTEAAFATVAGPADLRAAPGTAGRPLWKVKVSVVDATGHDTPPGHPGAIHVAGRDSVIPDTGTSTRRAGSAGRAGVRTGDVGWFDDAGRLFVAGREDDMVVVGGENVYPAVVEGVLEDHADLIEVAVVGAEDRALGQVLVAHVVKRRGAAVSADALRAWCRARLAPFEVPRRIVFHRTLPHGATGKVVKRFLTE